MKALAIDRVLLREPWEFGLTDSKIAAITPLVALPPSRTCPLMQVPGFQRVRSWLTAGNGIWLKLVVGLGSSSAQRRAGLWESREEWIWTSLEPARVNLVAHGGRGHMVALLETWARHEVVDSTLVAAMPDGLVPSLDGWAWIGDFSDVAAIHELHMETFRTPTYLHVFRRYAPSNPEKLPNPGDRGLWSTVLLSL